MESYKLVDKSAKCLYITRIVVELDISSTISLYKQMRVML